MPTLKRAVKTLFAASAMSFAFLLTGFLVVFMAAGINAADKVWGGIYPIAAWLVALAISIKWLK